MSGTRQKRIGAIYEWRGGKLERVTVLDAENCGTVLWRIRLESGLRGIGLFYGHCRSTVEGSQVGEFGVVGAARGSVSDGGAVNRLAVAHADRLARAALCSLPPLKVRHRDRTGRPRPITIIALVDAVCWLNIPMAMLARQHGWKTTSRAKARLRNGLIDGLEAVEHVWNDAHIYRPQDLGRIEVG